MTKEEFEIGYCERSGITIEDYHNHYNLVTLPCSCGYPTCNGWVAVSNIPLLIEAHNKDVMA